MSCDSLYNVDFLTGISHPTLFFHQLTSVSEVTSGTMDVPTLQPKRAAHHSPSFVEHDQSERKTRLGWYPKLCCQNLPSMFVLFHLAVFSFTKIDILGTSKVVNIIKELWTEFDETIALLCKGEPWSTPRANVKGYQSYREGMLYFPILLFIYSILFHGSGI